MITTVAIILGITLANVSSPVPGGYVAAGDRRYLEISEHYGSGTKQFHGIMGTILSLVPTNIVASMAKGEMLPIIFFSVLFGLGLSSRPRRIVNRW